MCILLSIEVKGMWIRNALSYQKSLEPQKLLLKNQKRYPVITSGENSAES
jgi:hypothetical protein